MTESIDLRNEDDIFNYFRREVNDFVQEILEGAHELGNFEESPFEIIQSDLNSSISYMFAVDGEVTNEEIDAITKISEILSYITDTESISREVHSIMLKRMARGEFEDLRGVALKPRCVICAEISDLIHGTDTALKVKRFVYNFLLSAAKTDGKITDQEQKLLDEIRTSFFESDNQIQENEPELVDDKDSLQSNVTSTSLPSGVDPQTELSKLIGLSNVKQNVSSLMNKIKINKVREEKGLPAFQPSLHMVFTGNPGTGKTTVARLLAAIYKDLGVLDKGHLVEVDRSNLVAGYVGQTAIKTSEVIKSAIGGVLFIDEAYSLVTGQDSYGDEAINTLLKHMEDFRNNLVVIVAGYEDEMTNFVNSNPGLRSRFDHFVEFPDYTEVELSQIFFNICDNMNMMLAESASQVLGDTMAELNRHGRISSGNARLVRKLFQQSASQQADRLAQLPQFSDLDLQTIEGEDILNASKQLFAN